MFRSTTTQAETEIASGRLPNGGRPRSIASAIRAPVWRIQAASVARAAKRCKSSSRWTRNARARPVAATYPMMASVSRVWCIASEKSSAARVYHIPDADLDGVSRRNKNGNRPLVTGALCDEVEVWRSPVFDKGRLSVPANPAIELLQVTAAATTGDDEVALILALRLETQQVLAALARAERALRARKEPAAPAEVTRQSPPAVLEHVREGGRGAAKRAHAECPVVRAEVSPRRGEVRLERGSKAPVGKERGH